MKYQAEPTPEFSDLVRIMHILRQECPWDREQTPESLKDLMVEEVYEAVDAIDRQDWDSLKKELGDMLLHVVFHAEMGQEKERFQMGDIIYALQEKLIRRHPHVFADTEAASSTEVTKNWEQIKKKENPGGSVLDGVPSQLPGLLRAQRMQEKAAGVGFDWPDWEGAWNKLEEEIREFKDALLQENAEERTKEFGDLLFSLVNVSRYFGINAEDSLRLTNNKFQQRFAHIEKRAAEAGKKLTDMNLEEMDTYWDEAKQLNNLK